MKNTGKKSLFIIPALLSSLSTLSASADNTIRPALIKAATNVNKELENVFQEQLQDTDMLVQIAISGAETAILRKVVLPLLNRASKALEPKSNQVSSVEVQNAINESPEAEQVRKYKIDLDSAINRKKELERQFLIELRETLEATGKNAGDFHVSSRYAQFTDSMSEQYRMFNEGANPWRLDDTNLDKLKALKINQRIIEANVQLDKIISQLEAAKKQLINLDMQLKYGKDLTVRNGKAVQKVSKVASVLSYTGTKLIAFASKAGNAYLYFSIGSRLYVVDVLDKNPGYIPVYEIASSKFVQNNYSAALNAATEFIDSQRK